MTISETAPDSGRFHYDGSRFGIAGLVLKVTALSVLTLGVYSFWGRAQIRRAIWGAVSLDGDRLDYTGTGGELLLGLLKAIAVLVGLGLAVSALGFGLRQLPAAETTQDIVAAALCVAVVGLGLAARYLALRYRLSRTAWRGVPLSLGGRAGGFVRGALVYALPAVLLAGPSLGLTLLWYRVREHRAWMPAVSVGGRRLESRLRFGQVLGPAVLMILIGAVALAAVIGPHLVPILEAMRTQTAPPDRVVAWLAAGFAACAVLAPATGFAVIGHPALKAACAAMAVAGPPVSGESGAGR